MATQAVFYRAPGGSQPVAEFLDQEFPVEPAKKKPSSREVQAAARRRATIDLQIDRLNELADNDPPLPFPHTSQIDGPLRELRCHYQDRQGAMGRLQSSDGREEACSAASGRSRRAVVPSGWFSTFAKLIYERW